LEWAIIVRLRRRVVDYGRSTSPIRNAGSDPRSQALTAGSQSTKPAADAQIGAAFIETGQTEAAVEDQPESGML
jgi:hypothetical protein